MCYVYSTPVSTQLFTKLMLTDHSLARLNGSCVRSAHLIAILCVTFHSEVLDGPVIWNHCMCTLIYGTLNIRQPFDAISKNDIKIWFEDLLLSTLLYYHVTLTLKFYRTVNLKKIQTFSFNHSQWSWELNGQIMPDCIAESHELPALPKGQ
jgi:hypothetical protein